MNRPFHISVVDDDEAVRKTLESFFKSMKFKVTLYCGAVTFLKALPDAKPDCLLLDVSLEGMSGPDLQRELIGLGYSIPIVFITANGTDAVQRRVMADGAIDFLMKPFGEEELLAALKKTPDFVSLTKKTS